jgi:hypothetical protein
MTPERWQQVKGVLYGALELAPEQRSAFLEQACSADHSRHSPGRLRSAIAARLGRHGRGLPRTRPQAGSGCGDQSTAAFLSSDPDGLRRFEQEARAAAALNHPDILAVLQMGTYEGAPYLVSELLDGV